MKSVGSDIRWHRHFSPGAAMVAVAVWLLPAAVLAADPPLAHWRFDEGTGTTVTDEIDDVTGNFMTPNPTWSTDVPSVSFTNTHSLQFSGTGDGVSIAWPAGYNFAATDPRSFSFWYKPLGDEENDETSHYNRILSCSNDRCEFAGTFGDVSVHRLAFYDGDWRDTGFNMTVGTWYNITFTYDGTDVKLYVAGEEEFSDASNGREMSGTLYVGVRHTGNEGINGRVDDLRIFDYALSPAQIDNIVAGSDNPDSPPVPTLSGALLPADNETGVAVGTNLVMTFSEAVQTGTGTITIKKASDDSTVETIDATGARVTGSGSNTITINPTADLEESTAYYVLVHANAFKNGAGGFYEGISSTTAWNFTTGDFTAPSVSTYSPADNATNVSTAANLVLTFDQVTRAGTGTLTIKKASDDSVVETITLSGALFSGNGTTELTINPSVTLAEGTSYYVTWTANAFKDTSGNHTAALTAATTWNFATTAPAAQTEEPSAPTGGGGGRASRGAGAGGVAASVRATQRMSQDSGSGQSHASAQVPQPKEQFVIRTCARASRWFAGNATMLARVNARLQKRFGFTCGS